KEGKKGHAQARVPINQQGPGKQDPTGGPEESGNTVFAFALKNGFEGGPGAVVIADFEFVVEGVELRIVVVPWRERVLPEKRGSALEQAGTVGVRRVEGIACELPIVIGHGAKSDQQNTGGGKSHVAQSCTPAVCVLPFASEPQKQRHHDGNTKENA